MELARQQHMRGREVPHGFRIFDDPDSLIIVCYKDGALAFPFGVPHRSTSTPAFLHAIRAAGLGVLGSATLITDPTGSGWGPCRSYTDPSAPRAQSSKKPK